MSWLHTSPWKQYNTNPYQEKNTAIVARNLTSVKNLNMHTAYNLMETEMLSKNMFIYLGFIFTGLVFYEMKTGTKLWFQLPGILWAFIFKFLLVYNAD
jgi:hypothetical protein